MTERETHPSMPDFYEKNLKLLKKRFPGIHHMISCNTEKTPFSIELYMNENGQVNGSIKIDGQPTTLFYDAEDIVAETKKVLSLQPLKQNDALICIGMGLGYVPLFAAQTYAQDTRLTIAEPSAALFDMTLHVMDFEDLFNYPRLDLYIGDSFTSNQIIEGHIKELYVGCVRRLTHVPSRKIFGRKFLSLEKEINEKVNATIINWNTIRIHGKKAFANSLDNLISLFKGVSLGELKGRFNGYPAVCVASGPSLSKDLEKLKKINNKALILACDSAVKPLLDAGVTPHMVFVVDHDKFDFEKIRNYVDQLRDTILFFFTEANPDSVKGYLGTKRVGITASSSLINHWLGPALNLNCQLNGTVTSNADAAILTAASLGADPIILMGMDLAYSGGQDHAGEALVRNKLDLDKMTLVEGIRGYPVYSSYAMVTGKVMLERQIAESGKRFIDSSIDGAWIKGAEIKAFDEILETELNDDKDVLNIINAVDWTPEVQWDEVLSIFNVFANKLVKLKADLIQGNTNVKRYLRKSNHFSWKKLHANTNAAMGYYRNINAKYQDVLNLLNCTRFQNQLETDRQISNLGGNSEDRKEEISIQALEILKDFFESLLETLDFFQPLIQEKIQYFSEINRHRRYLRKNQNVAGTILSESRLHLENNQLWLAEKSFLSDPGSDQEDAIPYTDLISGYMDMKLWQESKRLLEEGLKRFPEDAKLLDVKKDWEHKTSAVLQSAQKLFDQFLSGELNEWVYARAALIEYLVLVPDNEVALSLDRKIKLIEREQTESINQKTSFSYTESQIKQLEEKAKTFILNGLTEQAIGIFHGLLATLPEKCVQYHKSIADIRFFQKDYDSALWHYEKGLAHSDLTVAPYFKLCIQHVVPMAMAQTLKKPEIHVSILMLLEKADQVVMESLKGFSKDDTHEVLLMCPTDHLVALNSILDAQENKIACRIVEVEGLPALASTWNKTISKARGEYIVYIQAGLAFGQNGIMELLNILAAHPEIGLIMPRPVETPQRVLNESSCTLVESKDREESFNPELIRMDRMSANCFACRKSLFCQVGMLDEQLTHFPTALEDFRIRTVMGNFENKIAGLVTCSSSDTIENNPDALSLKKKYDIAKLPDCITNEVKRHHLFDEVRGLKEKNAFDQALMLLISTLKDDPNDEKVYLEISRILIDEGKDKDAYDALQQIPMKSQEKVREEKMELEAVSLLNMGRIEEASDILGLLFNNKPKNGKVCHFLGMVAQAKGDDQSAMNHFKMATQLDPYHGQAHSSWGKLLLKFGETEQGFDLLRKGFSLNPRDSNLLKDYYQQALRFNCTEMAANDLIAIITEGYRNDKQIHFLLIDLLLNQGNYSTAMGLIEKCMARFGPEEGMVSAALTVREALNARNHGEQNPIAKNLSLAVILKEDTPGIEKVFYQCNSQVDRMFLFHDGNATVSENIARAYGVSIIKIHPTNKTEESATRELLIESNVWLIHQNEINLWLDAETEDIRFLGKELERLNQIPVLSTREVVGIQI